MVVLFAFAFILFSNATYGTKWAIIIEAIVIFGHGKEPLVTLLEDGLTRLELTEQFSWVLDVIISSQGQLFDTGALLGISLLILLQFPFKVFKDWREDPWTFLIGYFIFTLSIFESMKLLGKVIVKISLYQYGERGVHPLVRKALGNSITIFLLAKYTKLTGNNSNSKEEDQQQLELLKEWRDSIISWGTPKSEYVCRNRLLFIIPQLEDVDSKELAIRAWAVFSKVHSSDPTITWSDFMDSILTGYHQYRRDGNCYSHLDFILLKSDLDRVESLEVCLDKIIKDSKKLGDKVKEQDRLFNQLSSILSMVWVILIIFVILPLLGFTPNNWLLPLGVSITPTVVALTVVFGQTISSIITSIVFTFYTHPFDVGDEVRIEKDYFSVKRIGLIFNVFENGSGILVYYPTSELSKKSIVNISRSSVLLLQVEISFPCAFKYNLNKVGFEVSQKIRSFKGEKFPVTFSLLGSNQDSRICFLIQYPFTKEGGPGRGGDSTEFTKFKQEIFNIILDSVQSHYSVSQ